MSNSRKPGRPPNPFLARYCGVDAVTFEDIELLVECNTAFDPHYVNRLPDDVYEGDNTTHDLGLDRWQDRAQPRRERW